MDKVLFLISLWIAKLISFLISILKLGQASNFPGKIALKLQKDFIKHFKIKDDCKIVLITGTNGKSTTCGLLASMLKKSGGKVIYNKSGANLLSGISSTLSHYSSISGELNSDCIILEVDEATFPLFTEIISPDIIAVTNFFRDQLDRYGELDTTVKLIEKGLNYKKSNNKNTLVILNADDPKAAFIKTENEKILYSIAHADTFKEISTYTNYDLKKPEINFLVTEFKSDDQTINFNLSY